MSRGTVHIRLERSEGLLESLDDDGVDTGLLSQVLILGPFEWVQLTYGDLRISPDGAQLARNNDGWWLSTAANGQGVSSSDQEQPFSDVVIYP